MPFMNSSLVNSHCISARNFHAIIRTNLLSGVRPRSSKNFMMPSAMILSVSLGSANEKVNDPYTSILEFLPSVESTLVSTEENLELLLVHRVLRLLVIRIGILEVVVARQIQLPIVLRQTVYRCLLASLCKGNKLFHFVAL